MTSALLLTTEGEAAARKAVCHEVTRRMVRFFQRQVVIAVDQYIATGVFDFDTFVGDLNDEHVPEILLLYELSENSEVACKQTYPPIPNFHAHENNEISTNSTTWQVGLSLTIPEIKAGTYLLLGSYDWRISPPMATYFNGRIVDVSNPSNVVSFVTNQTRAVNEWNTASGHDIMIYSDGPVSLQFQFYTSNAIFPAYARNIRISLIQIA